MSRRRLKFLLVLVLVACLSTGCWDKKEFNKISFAETIAIDRADGRYIVTLQLMVPKNLQEGGENAPIWIVGGQGETIALAVDDLVLRAPREIYWGHLKVVLLGESVLQEDLGETVDFFTRDSQLRRRNYFLATEGEARKVLEAKPDLAQINTVYIYNLIEDQERRVRHSTVTLNDVLVDLSGDGIDLFLPRIALLSNKEAIEGRTSPGKNDGGEQSDDDKKSGSEVEGDKVLELSGGALIRDGKLAKWADKDWTNGYYWVNGQIRQGTMVIEHPFAPESKFSMKILDSHAQLSLVQKEPLTLKLHITSKLNIAENSSKTSEHTSKERPNTTVLEAKDQIEQLEQLANEKIRGQVENSLTIARQDGCDVFGLGRWLKAYHPNLSAQLPAEGYLDKINLIIEVDSKIKLAMIIN